MTGRRLSRRGFFALTGAAAAGLALANCGLPLLREGQTAELLSSELPLPRPFQVPLPVPPVARPVRTDGGVDYYEIVQRETMAEILPGRQTPIFGYDGIFPGPTIVSRRGRPTVVNHINELPIPSVVHLHGGHTPADSDGYPTDLVLPRSGWDLSHEVAHGMVGSISEGSREYTYPMNQRAATLWYHDHRMDFTGPAVWRGLAGFHLIRDDEEDALPLPSGDRELPLMITDRAFAADGRFRYPSLDAQLRSIPGVEPDYAEGVVGDVVLVNGAPWPVAEVAGARYRLRLLNASNARRYRLALDPAPDGGTGFVQIGSDGGLLARPVPRSQVDLAPAERADVIVDFAQYPPGAVVTLVNQWESGPAAQVMRFVVGRRVADDSSVPEVLSTVDRLDPATAARSREWRLSRGPVNDHQGWVINGEPFDPRRSLAQCRLGEVELWRLRSDLHHPLHVHLDSFQLVSRRGRPPAEHEAGWKDTVDLRPGETVEIAVRFTDYAGRFMLHCHNLEHEDMAMMAAFDTA